jgi:IS5 family transposase
MAGLLLLKQVEDLSDEAVVLGFKRNPYYQASCGLTEFSLKPPCDSSGLAKFRARIGVGGINRIFEVSVLPQGKAALEDTANIDTTVQEKNITYPTDGKLAVKTIDRLNKLAKGHGIQQRRTYGKEAKALRLSLRHSRHVKRRGKAKKAPKRLRTIAHALIRELRRTLPKVAPFERYQKGFLFYERVLGQRPTRFIPYMNPRFIASPKARATRPTNTAIKCPLR